MSNSVSEPLSEHPEATLGLAADWEAVLRVQMSHWWSQVTGGLPYPGFVTRLWRLEDGLSLRARIEIRADQTASADVMETARTALNALGFTGVRYETNQSRVQTLIGRDADEDVRVDWSSDSGMVAVTFSGSMRLEPRAARRILGTPVEDMPFLDVTEGPLALPVLRSNALGLVKNYDTQNDRNDPFTLGPPDHVVDIGWAYVFPWCTRTWYQRRSIPDSIPHAGPVVTAKATGATWMLNGKESYEAQLAAEARSRGYRHDVPLADDVFTAAGLLPGDGASTRQRAAEPERGLAATDNASKPDVYPTDYLPVRQLADRHHLGKPVREFFQDKERLAGKPTLERRMFVYERGMVVENVDPPFCLVLPWAAVAECQYDDFYSGSGGMTSTFYGARLKLTNGDELGFGVNLRGGIVGPAQHEGMRMFGPTIDGYIAAEQLPATMANLAMGKEAEFGQNRIRISRAGLRYPRTSLFRRESTEFVELPWSDVDRITFHESRGCVSARVFKKGRRGPWMQQYSSRYGPNNALYVAVLKEFVTHEGIPRIR
ncbi:hypothetical protein [Nocardia sp. NPDC127526]|uniref:hypothetical protein n=1 Tax=Nocardia sp. NPDC127526 TaxID=3345393 RepID=UPI003634269D